MKTKCLALLIYLGVSLSPLFASGTPESTILAIQDCISASAPTRVAFDITDPTDVSCSERLTLATALLRCNHACYSTLGPPTDMELVSALSDNPCFDLNVEGPPGDYTCSDLEFCTGVSRYWFGDTTLDMLYLNSPPPSTSPIVFEPLLRRRAEDSLLGPSSAHTDEVTLSGTSRKLAVETANEGSVFIRVPFQGLGFSSSEVPTCEAPCEKVFPSPLVECLRSCEDLRLSTDPGAVPETVTCLERETLFKGLIECNHECYQENDGRDTPADVEGFSCLGVGETPYTCSASEVCDAVRGVFGLPGSSEFSLEYLQLEFGEFLEGDIFASEIGVFMSSTDTCQTTCEALFVSSETILPEEVAGPTEGVQGGVAGTVAVSTTTKILGGAAGGSGGVAGIGTVQTGGAVQSLFQTGGIDAVEGATEGIASQVKKKEPSARMLGGSAMQGAKEAATTMLTPCWPYIIFALQFLAVFAKFLLLGLSLVAAISYTSTLPTVEAALNPVKLLGARFSPQPELLPIRLNAWLGPVLVANTGGLGKIGEERCLEPDYSCVDEATFKSSSTGPFMVEFLARASPNDTFGFLQYALFMDVAMSVVGLVFVLYFSPLVRGLPCVKNSKCKRPHVSHIRSQLITLAVVIPSLGLSIYVLVQVLQNNLYDLTTVGWVTDEGTNQTLRIVPVRAFVKDGASFVEDNYGNLTECMDQAEFDAVRPRLVAKQTETFFHCEVASMVFDDFNDCITYNCPGPLVVNSLNWFRSATTAMTNELVIPSVLIDFLLTGAELLGLLVALVFFLRKRNKLKKAEGADAAKDEDIKEI